MQQPHRRSPLTATTRTHAAATVAPRALPGRALPQPHVSFSDTHRPRSTCEPHTHRREVLIDPLHGLVLAVTARRPGDGEGQDPWSCAWGQHIVLLLLNSGRVSFGPCGRDGEFLLGCPRVVRPYISRNKILWLHAIS
ncbi:hypothetical protein VPH35_106744 [Triticum aestivum]